MLDFQGKERLSAACWRQRQGSRPSKVRTVLGGRCGHYLLRKELELTCDVWYLTAGELQSSDGHWLVLERTLHRLIWSTGNQGLCLAATLKSYEPTLKIWDSDEPDMATWWCKGLPDWTADMLGPVIPVRLSSEPPKALAGLKTSSLPRCSLTNRRWLLRQSEVQIQGKLLDDKKSCAPVDIPGLPRRTAGPFQNSYRKRTHWFRFGKWDTNSVLLGEVVIRHSDPQTSWPYSICSARMTRTGRLHIAGILHPDSKGWIVHNTGD